MCLFWSNEGNKLCIVVVVVLCLSSSVCKESALKTHRRKDIWHLPPLESNIITVCGCFQECFFLFFNNADANHVNPKFIFFQYILHCVRPTGGAECAEHCNYFVQNLVKILVC